MFMLLERLFDCPIQFGGGYILQRFSVNFKRRGDELMNALLFKRRDGDDGEIERPIVFKTNFFFIFVECLIVFFNRIPFIERDDRGFAACEDFIGDFFVVFREADRRVNQVDCNIAPADCFLGARY
jgi:hypothetical protein